MKNDLCGFKRSSTTNTAMIVKYFSYFFEDKKIETNDFWLSATFKSIMTEICIEFKQNSDENCSKSLFLNRNTKSMNIKNY